MQCNEGEEIKTKRRKGTKAKAFLCCWKMEEDCEDARKRLQESPLNNVNIFIYFIKGSRPWESKYIRFQAALTLFKLSASSAIENL